MTHNCREAQALAEKIIDLVGEDKKRVLSVKIEATGDVTVERVVLNKHGKAIPVAGNWIDSLDRVTEEVTYESNWPEVLASLTKEKGVTNV